MRHTVVPALLALPTTLALALTFPADASPRVAEYAVDLQPVNKPAAEGAVSIAQTGTRLTVELAAAGLDGGVHVAHIHGVRAAENECPSLADDNDNDGFVDLVEGLPSYGPVQVTLSNGTSDRGTALSYERGYTHLDNGDGIASLGDLDQYAIVVHGVDLDGDGQATNPNIEQETTPDHDDNEITMPALCGTIETDD